VWVQSHTPFVAMVTTPLVFAKPKGREKLKGLRISRMSQIAPRVSQKWNTVGVKLAMVTASRLQL
jgi:hypothetical protein